MTYNYKKAGDIWDRLINITYDMPDYLDFTSRQIERRYFLRILTRDDNIKKNLYIDWISDFMTDLLNDQNKKELEKIALEIVLFTNDNNF